MKYNIITNPEITSLFAYRFISISCLKKPQNDQCTIQFRNLKKKKKKKLAIGYKLKKIN